jgi:D-aminoacyl-tRNA deacylase
MFRKFLVVASKQDPAGVNITTNLSQFRKNPLVSAMDSNSRGFDFYLVEDDILHEENLDLSRFEKYDFIIFASKHSSAKDVRCLSVHCPGNWGSAEHGGKDGKASMGSALFNKQFFEILNKNVKEYELKDYEISMEATHHGPLIDKPCVFVEIGSNENQWKDRKAGFILAKTINDVIESYEDNPYNEIAVGVGGPHYCPNFKKIQLDSNFAISHVIPHYIFPLNKEDLREALKKTFEEVDLVLVDWKGIKNPEDRHRLTELLDKMYIRWKKNSDVKI